jgi:hypothetical protein
MKNNSSFVEGLITLLVKHKAIAANQAAGLQKAFGESSKATFDEFLLDEGFVDKEHLLAALADYYQVPSFDAQGYFFDHQLVRLFEKEFLKSNAIIPIERDENILIMLANSPTDQDLLPRINRYVSDDIQFRVGILQDIYDAIEEFYDQALTEYDYDTDLDENRYEREEEIREQEEFIDEKFEE